MAEGAAGAGADHRIRQVLARTQPGKGAAEMDIGRVQELHAGTICGLMRRVSDSVGPCAKAREANRRIVIWQEMTRQPM
jgi:hypothetical protein